jgi:hypothetical protein
MGRERVLRNIHLHRPVLHQSLQAQTQQEAESECEGPAHGRRSILLTCDSGTGGREAVEQGDQDGCQGLPASSSTQLPRLYSLRDHFLSMWGDF